MKLFKRRADAPKKVDMLNPEDFNHDYFHGGYGGDYPKEGYEFLFDSGLDEYFSRILDFVMDQKGTKIRLLDVGCAYGFLVKLAYERGIDAYGLDISSYAIERGQELNPEIKNRLLIGNAEEVDRIFGKKRFDVITALGVLPRIFQPRKALSSFRSCLRRNGWLLITTPKRTTPKWVGVSIRPLKYWIRELRELGFKVKAPYLFDTPYDSKNMFVRELGKNYVFAEMYRFAVAHTQALLREYGNYSILAIVR